MTITPYVRPISLAETNIRNIVNNIFQLTNFVNADATINANNYGVRGDGVTSDTTALQKFFNACQNNKGFLPAGKYKITAPITIDATKNYCIEGAGWDPNAIGSSVIYNVGSGTDALSFINSGAANNNLLALKNFTVTGSSTTGNGITANNIHGLLLENVWITTNGGIGLSLQKCFGCDFKNVVSTQNGQYGLQLSKQNNQIVFDHCTFNANSRTDGFSNVTITATTGTENLAITFIGCDNEGAGDNPFAGSSVSTAFGITIQHSQGVNLLGCYFENNSISGQLFADNSTVNLTCLGNYFQDGANTISGMDGLVYENNVHARVNSATSITITGALPAGRTRQRIAQNSYLGGATSSFSNGAAEIAVAYSASSPTSGAWNQGDIVWNSSPTAGGFVGFVCVSAGTPGTWKTFGAIST